MTTKATYLAMLILAFSLCSCSPGGQPEPEQLKPRVVKNLFSTGAGPNDMVYGNSSLYIANSMDNSVVRYSTNGEVLASHQFGEFASPSFLALSGETDEYLWVVNNGDDTLQALDSGILEPAEGLSFRLSTPALFTGPSQPVVSDNHVVVPRSQITDFGPPSVYGPGNAFLVGLGNPNSPAELGLEGANAQFATSGDGHGSGGVYIASTGELQFDDLFNPYVETDSIVQYWLFGQDPEHVFSANLGKIGAGRMAVNPLNHTLYIGNSLSGNLYAIDTTTHMVSHGESNPIALTGDFTFISDVAVSPDRNLVFAASFNTDEVFVVHSFSNQVSPAGFEAPFDLSLDPGLLAGCSNLEVAPAVVDGFRFSVYVLHAVANSVSRIDIP